MNYSLVLLLLIPLVGALVGAALPSARAARYWALAVCLAALLLGICLASQFQWHKAAASGADTVQLTFGPGPLDQTSPLMFPALGSGFRLGVDSVSLWLVLLTVFLQPLAILSSFQSIREREKEYYAWMLVLLSAMLGVFLARDLLLFYVFFELTLIPMFFIIGIWGGPERRHAASKFFLFTFTGSVFTLAAVIYLGLGRGFNSPNFDIDAVVAYAQTGLTPGVRYLLVLGLLAGFAVKVPLFPVHTWLPLAHTEAPTAGSVILAGVLLKLGTYGFLRLALPIGFVHVDFDAVVAAGHWVPFTSLGAFQLTFGGLLQFIGVLCLIGIIYGALVAWVQRDIKKLVAYSSVSHLGFCILGLMALNNPGIQGSVLYMINHGLSTGALFLVIGMIYDRYHTRDIDQLSGLARRMPVLAFFFVLFALSSIGLPGLNGFVSEFLTILGAFTSKHLGPRYGVFASLGIILGAVYMLHMVARVIWGPLKTPAVHDGDHGHDEATPGDIGAREVTILVPLAIAVILLGVLPTPMLRSLLAPAQYVQRPVEFKAPVVPARAPARAGGRGWGRPPGTSPAKAPTTAPNRLPTTAPNEVTEATPVPQLAAAPR